MKDRKDTGRKWGRGEEEKKEGGTSGKPLPAAFTEGDSEASRQDTTQSHKRFHISDTHRGHGGVTVSASTAHRKNTLWAGSPIDSKTLMQQRSSSQFLSVCLSLSLSLFLLWEQTFGDVNRRCVVWPRPTHLHAPSVSMLFLVKSVKWKLCRKPAFLLSSPAVQGAEINLSSFEKGSQGNWHENLKLCICVYIFRPY